MNNKPATAPMTTACSASALARAWSPPPSARLTADETPPPIAPADIICTSMTTGNTSAMPASDAVPRAPMYDVSPMVTSAVAVMVSVFGILTRSRVGRIGPVSNGLAGRGAVMPAGIGRA